MKYQIGDLFVWNIPPEEVCFIIEIYRDWNGELKYKMKSYIKQGTEEYVTEGYTEQELDIFRRNKTLIYYPVIE
jgi:hypothetical protein